MRLLRGLLGALLWIPASLLGLVAVVLCVTVILLPVGVPLLMLSRRMFTKAVQLLLPRSMSHPVEELGKSARKKGRNAKRKLPAADDVAKKGRKAARRQSKRLL